MVSCSVRSARFFDFNLTDSNPLHVFNNHFTQETPLDIEIHAGVEVSIILSGAQEHHLKDFTRALYPGDVLLTTAWEPHGWRITSPNTEDLLFVFLPQWLGEERLGEFSWLDLFIAAPKQRPQISSTQVRESVFSLAYELREEIRARNPGWEAAARLGVLRLLLILSRDWQPPPIPFHKHNGESAYLTRIIPALTLVQSNLRHRITVEEAANTCGLSRAQFSLVFRQAMGVSFAKYSLRTRLASAAQLLVSSNSSLDAIADQTGFTDSSHLHHAFVKYYRCTPGDYRVRSNLQFSLD